MIDTFHEFRKSDDLEVAFAGELSNTFVFSQLKKEVTAESTTSVSSTTKISRETYFIVAVMRIERYYASLKEEKSNLTKEARILLERQDYVGFFKGCGPNFIRGIRRAQEVSAIFKFTSSTTELASDFTKSLKATSKQGAAKEEVATTDFSTQSKYDAITSNLQIDIVGFGLGLNGPKGESLVASNVEEFKEVMSFAFNIMTKTDDASHAGMVYGIEIAPWVENVQFQKASGLYNGDVKIPLSRNLIPKSYRLDTDGRTKITRYDSSLREEYRCKNQGLEIDKYGFCCEPVSLYDNIQRIYNFTNPEERMCRPIRQLDPPILKENMAKNAEFAVRLDKALQEKTMLLSTLQRCVTEIRSIPATQDFNLMSPNDSVDFGGGIDFDLSVLQMKAAIDPTNDYELVTHLGKEFDEYVDMFYQPCLAALYGANVGNSPTTDTNYFMAYPWHNHAECINLSCLGTLSRWDRRNGGCTPGILSGVSAQGYDDSDEFCSYNVDSRDFDNQVCKYPQAEMSDYHDKVTGCWEDVLPSSEIVFLMEHFCTTPTIGDSRMEESSSTELQENYDLSCNR